MRESKLTGDKMQTLSQCMNSLKEKGYSKEFNVSEDKLITKEDQKSYSPKDVQIVDFYRFEGDSNPSDNAILYAIETNDGAKGVLVDAYGMYADEFVTKFINEVEEIEKKKAGNPTAAKENPVTQERI